MEIKVHQLPIDLHRPIITLLPRADLFTLTMVSQAMQFEAERLIYRNIKVHKLKPLIQCLKAIKSRPRLGHHVQSLTVRITFPNYAGRRHPRVFVEPLRNLFVTALQNMTRLHHLSFDLQNWMYRNISGFFARAFDLSFPFKLRTFKYQAAELDFDGFVPFLESQPDIQTLSMKTYYTTYLGCHSFSPDTLLPNLTVLEDTSQALALLLLPGRPITHLKICIARSSDTGNLGLSAGPITVLYLDHGISLVERLCQSLPALTPDLEMLGGFRLTSKEDIDQCIHLVSQFEHLRRLELVIGPFLMFENRDFFERLHSGFPPSITSLSILEERSYGRRKRTQWQRGDNAWTETEWGPLPTMWAEAIAGFDV